MNKLIATIAASVTILIIGACAPAPDTSEDSRGVISSSETESAIDGDNQNEAPPPSPSPVATMVINPDGSQTLPIGATLTVGEEVITLEVAATPQQQATGLMFRTEMAADHGMLFNFPEARPVSFWMKNTLIPLDMVFVYQGEIKAIKSDVPPCEGDPCPSYGSGAYIDQVIELNAGRAATLGLKPGQTIDLTYLAVEP